MNNNKTHAVRWLILPALFCSMAVLAGDGGLNAPTGVIPQASQSALTLDDSSSSADAAANDADSGNTARAETFDNAQLAAAPDATAQAQQLGKSADGFVDDAKETSSLNTGYVGGNTRIGVGIDSQFKGKADLSHVFAEDGKSATIGQGYVGVDPRSGQSSGHITGAGVKVSQHWVSTDANGQPDHVNKVFGAYDQNGASDKNGTQGKKLTVGYGQETENMFWSGSVSKGLSGKSDTGLKDANGNTIFEKAYDYGVGGRVGTFISEQQMRVQGGLDYEWGSEHAATESKAKQVTLSGSAEKFFPGTPHSVNVDLDVHKKSGGFAEGSQKAEVRGGVGYRYDIASDAGIWQADQQYKRVRVEIPGEPVQQAAKVERKLVKHTMELEGDTFFLVDKATLTPEAQKRLQAVVAQMRDAGHEGNIRISGHTCDIGSDAHNQQLSERRANAVRDFLAKNGFNSEELLAEGLGEANPKYPNTTTERHKNRRVDIEYVTHQTKYKDEVVEEGGTTPTDPKVVWRQELIPSPPLWVRQALHNVADHKERVDTYKTTAGGAPVTPPPATCKISADNDDYQNIKKGDPETSLNILDGDTDCNGNPVTGSTVTINHKTDPTHGTVDFRNGFAYYTPDSTYVDSDSFTYTITDTAGNVSNVATVTVGACTSGCTGKPLAQPDTYPAGTTSGNVLTDGTPDTDPNGATSKLKVTTVGTLPTSLGGSVTISADGSFTFDGKGIAGDHLFTYFIVDEEGLTDSAVLTIKVAGGGSCPVGFSKSDTIVYTYTNKEPLDIQNIDATKYINSAAGDVIEEVYLTGHAVYEQFNANGTPGGRIDVNGNGIKFTPSASTYCKSGTFVFYIKLKGCNTPIEVTITVNESSLNP